MSRLELPTGGGGRGGRWWSWKVISNRRQRASCNLTHTWPWWHRFWFLAWFNSTYPLEEMTQWCRGSSFFFLITGDLVALAYMLNSCCKLRVLFCIWVLCSNLTVTPQVKTVPSPLPELWISSTLWLFLPFVLSRGLQILVLLNNISFHACFWTSWPWNKDTVLLYSIQYSKIHKTQPLVEDTHMWQCTPDMWTNMRLDMQMNVLIFKVCDMNIHMHEAYCTISTWDIVNYFLQCTQLKKNKVRVSPYLIL